MKSNHQTYPTPYGDLNNVLRELVDSVRDILKTNFAGAYLQGSFAVGDFDVNSDVDFIVVINEELSDEQIHSLQEMHDRIFQINNPWATCLEGSYFQKDVLRQHDNCDTLLWYLDNGHRSMEKSTHCNSVLVRWIVRENGVILAGPPPSTLVDPIPVERLRAEIKATMVNWGQEIIDNPNKYRNQFYQSFIVLSYCRMLHDLINGYPGSKLAGAEWAKANLDPQWQGLIDRTWPLRINPSVSVRTPADPEDFEATLKFMQYVISESTKYGT